MAKQHCSGLRWEFESLEETFMHEKGFKCGTKQVHEAFIKSNVLFL